MRARSQISVVGGLFRLFLALLFLGILGLLYWSNLLIETELKELRNELRQSRSQISDLQIMRTPVEVARPHINSSLPNLLQEDPFYQKTLPDLLPAAFKPRGTIRVAEVGHPVDLSPFTRWSPVVALHQLCGGSLAKTWTGVYDRFAPDLALKIEEREGDQGPEYWVHLREGMFWQPLHPKQFLTAIKLAPMFLTPHPVTAWDFKFYYDVCCNPYVQESGAQAERQQLDDLVEFKVVDDLTFVMRWRSREYTLPNGTVEQRIKHQAWEVTAGLQPLPRWVYQYFSDGRQIIDDPDPDAYRTNSVWAQYFTQHWARGTIVSCGPWYVDSLSDEQIRLRRNPYYHEPLAALTEYWVTYFRGSPDVIWQDFKADLIDLFDTRIAPQKLTELSAFRSSPTYASQLQPIQQLDYLERAYRYVAWNQARPLFASPIVRRALTMAIDRQRIIDQCLHSRGIETTGPFFPKDSSYAHELAPWPYDPAEAKHLLRQEGWEDRDGDGILDRMTNGIEEKFSFKLLYYAHSHQIRLLVDSIATSLREIGVDCRLIGVDVADLAAAMDNKEFDAVSLAWMIPRPDIDPKLLWHSSGAKEKGSYNYIGFVNSEIDSLIDELRYSHNPIYREKLYKKFHAIIHEEEPYTFLYVPKTAWLYRSRLRNLFIPVERPDLIPHATITVPSMQVCWISEEL